jgi:integrase/recombinase XerD
MARKKYPGSIERRGDSYRVTLCVAGKISRSTVPTTDRRIAEQFARQRFSELRHAHERQFAGLPHVITISALISEFVTQELPQLAKGTREAYEDSLKPIRKYFIDESGDLPLDRIRAAHIDAYMDWRRANRYRGRRKADDRPVHARTLNKDRAVLHRLFVIADRREYVSGNPVARTEPRKADTHESVILTEEEYEKLLKACGDNPMLGLYVLLLGETGMRCESEALHLRWEDINLTTGFLTIRSGRDGHRTKSGKSRDVPMTPRLAAALRSYFAEHRLGGRSQYIFHHATTRRHHSSGARIESLRSAFLNAVARANLPKGFRQHDLRHRRVTTWLAQGKSPALVQQAMGHSDVKTTMGYYKFLPEHLRSLVDSVPSVPAAQAM